MYQYKFATTLYYDSPEKMINYIYNGLEFDDCEGRRICLEPDFKLSISNIIAKSDEQAFKIACEIADKMCRGLVLKIQSENYENLENHPCLICIPHNMKMVNKGEYNSSTVVKKSNGNIHVHDGLILREKLSISSSIGLDLKDLEEYYNNIDRGKILKVGDSIYRAVLSRNIRGRFFQLFTIIEAIEAKYGKDKDIAHPIIPDKEVKYKFNEILTNHLDEFLLDKVPSDSKKSLLNRITNLVTNATIEPRKTKLMRILIDKLNISKVKKGLMNYEITEEKMKKFIDTRNSLFHGGESELNENELVQLTNELQELCLEILKKEEL